MKNAIHELGLGWGNMCLKLKQGLDTRKYNEEDMDKNSNEINFIYLVNLRFIMIIKIV